MQAEARGRAQLIVELVAGEGAAERLEAVLAAVPVASVIIAAAAGRPLTAKEVLPLVAAGQSRGAAVLVAGDAGLARTVKADGTHVPFVEDMGEPYETARSIVGSGAVVGADAGRSRHDAMTLAELGADYVAFGIPDFVKDRESAVALQLELIGWWAEIFEVPCVAMDVDSPEQARELAAAGADFVCLRLESGIAAADAVALARDWSAVVAVRPDPAR